MRLIDADELMKSLDDLCKNCENNDYILCDDCDLADAISYVEDAPTIDAQPVKRGKWRLVVERVITSKYACSECDSVYAIPSELSPEGFYCYCPNCGAKMRR